MFCENMSLDDLARSLREFEGVTRKHAIGPLVKWFLPDDDQDNFGEDAAIINRGPESLLIAADGIWSKLMDADSEWAGYCSILVNIHDIVAMGGTPLAMVDVLSASSLEVSNHVLAGMSEAVKKFGIPVVGGHIHPDTDYNALDVAILGVVKSDSIVYSSKADEDEDVIAAVDLDGRVHPSCSLCWDTTTMRRPEILKKQIGVMKILGEQHIVTSGKDISNPGMLGTLGMLLEVSRVGALIDLDSIPIPEGVEMQHWLKMYPGMGFIVTANPENTKEVLKVFEAAEMAAAVIGKITDTNKLEIAGNNEKATVFDFNFQTIMGIKKADCE
ncbi:MAG TPA: methanogenesis marker 2 protein [Candidatus Acidoferrales bacterium]|nr:methanogenesis marker 2 protein [Candidatus Acidoferrales bacterium]